MANTLLKIFYSDLIAVRGQQIRYGHKVRGKPPGIARTLAQRLEELNTYDPKVDYKVDIGLPVQRSSKRLLPPGFMEQIKQTRSDTNLERLARNRQLIVDLEDVKNNWEKISWSTDIHKVADYYGIFRDLYGDAYFYPVVPIDISYSINEDEIAKAFRGNILKPIETSKPPEVTYESNPDSLWTLLLTCPDGNLVEEDSEYCHWFIGNIPGNSIEKGEVIIDYLKPFPLYGTGYHRYVFVLYKQEKKLDFSSFRKEQPCIDLRERNWSTYHFYRDHQDQLTPAGLAFFQSDWDTSVTEFFHKTLEMKEPRFEYDFPPPYIKKQVWFPLRQPFNLYMDKYRDPKQINKEYFLKKLKTVHPFKTPEPSLRFPNAQYIDQNVPSWLKTEIIKNRLKWGRINEI
ncbi:39S ribosomal protein L38, mitochondrial [Athalia rosae]|uniref:39S ribosomal protein L38, mitochondrial n=1 Tax=Athalia rosae TaxID=37344 RepID=UPI002034415E|nr:39S ribosomal protein L38, mitochondrial [Athalia rosae]